MNFSIRTSLQLFILCISATLCLGQESTQFGRYQQSVDKATEYINLIKEKDKGSLKDAFYDTGFQDKKEFSKNINGKNLQWASNIIKEYGIPSEDEISISVWKVGSKGNENTETSINVSLYFKQKGTDHSPTNDRISINLVEKEGEYLIDGILFFKKSDYEKMKKIINDMP